MLKKLMVLSVLICGTIFASNSELDIKEDRIELQLNQSLKNTKGEYDVDLSETSANVQLEVKSANVKKDKNYNDEAEQVLAILKSHGINDVYFYVEEDKLVGEDEVIFQKTFK